MIRSILPALVPALIALGAPALSFAKPPPADTTGRAAVAKAGEGKSAVYTVTGTGDIGAVASNAPYAVVPVTVRDAKGKALPEIAVLMAPESVPAFLKTVTPVKTGAKGVFGSKMKYGTFTATYLTLAGEPALVVGAATPGMKTKKPSAVLADQLAAAKDADTPTVVESSQSPVKRAPGPKVR